MGQTNKKEIGCLDNQAPSLLTGRQDIYSKSCIPAGIVMTTQYNTKFRQHSLRRVSISVIASMKLCQKTICYAEMYLDKL